MKFSLVLHIVLAAIAIGLAMGLNQVSASPLLLCPSIGLAASLAVTGVVRGLIEIKNSL